MLTTHETRAACSAAEVAYEKRQKYLQQVDQELLACRQLLYQVSRKGHALKLLKAVKGFLRMTVAYKEKGGFERSPGEDADNLLPLY